MPAVDGCERGRNGNGGGGGQPDIAGGGADGFVAAGRDVGEVVGFLQLIDQTLWPADHSSIVAAPVHRSVILHPARHRYAQIESGTRAKDGDRVRNRAPIDLVALAQVGRVAAERSEEHTSELQSRQY